MDATKLIMAGGFGTLAGLALLTLPDALPPAVASEEPVRTLLRSASELWPPAFNPEGLMKWDYYLQPSVSMEPIRESTIRKIGYGKTTLVNVTETSSGIYSTDALASSHIQYPGIIKDLKPAQVPLLRVWDGQQWTVQVGAMADSFVAITPFAGGTLITGADGNCAVIGDSTYC